MSEDDPIQQLIDLALAEDLGEAGDITSQFFVPEGAMGEARIFAKESLVISGLQIAQRVFAQVDPGLQVNLDASDGDCREVGGDVLHVSGSLRSILTAERTALNFLQQLSGVATLTHEFVDRVAGTKAKILDTRKTTPGWRTLEKQAVVHGGAVNHRIGLFDQVMVKDNHLLAGADLATIQKGIEGVKSKMPRCRIELEVDTLEQLQAFLGLEGVDQILLDNMTLDQLRSAVEMRDKESPAVVLEASGGVNLDTVRGIAETGVDYISVGALTHSARAVDLSLELVLAE